ncbi:MAG: hypothetical protein EOO09_20160 [Chitinophagaceae bacterium]|nr:MAG: hypothetical protein EOO09_20160 [Chitinophagaceae bacterium]
MAAPRGRFTLSFEGSKFLCDWVETARATDFSPLDKAADMIEKHSQGILIYLMHPVTNAVAEGISSVIQSLKHAAISGK